MPAAFSKDLRWRVVWGRDLLDLSHAGIAQNLQLSERTVRRILNRFDATGDVRTHQGQRGGLQHAAPQNQKMTPEQDLKLLELVTILDDKSMLTEIHHQFYLSTGTDVHISTICRAMRRLGFTRKKARAPCTCTPLPGRRFRGRRVTPPPWCTAVASPGNRLRRGASEPILQLGDDELFAPHALLCG